MEYDVQKCTRRCAVSGRELQEGETFFSVLVAEGPAVGRRDFAPDAWQGPPEGALGWWKSKVPTRESRRARMAPSEVLLELFHELEDHVDKADMRYVLALLLVRRRVLRIEEPATGTEDPATENADRGTGTGLPVLTLYCTRDDTTHRVACVPPDKARAEQIQAELGKLLFAG